MLSISFTINQKYCYLRVAILLILSTVNNFSSAQYNLVPNSSFEFHSNLCNNISPGTGGILNWYSPTNNNPNLYTYNNACVNNSCCGVPINTFGHSYQNAHSGVAYIDVGFFYKPSNIASERTYLQTKLQTKLLANNCYYVEFFINVNDFYLICCNNIGLLIGDTSIISNAYQVLNAIPQILLYKNPIISDTMNWVRIGGIYTAHGGEQFITIGNFKDDQHTDTIHLQPPGILTGTAYYIDDVSVIPLDSMQLKAEAGRDTTIVKGDSVWIGSRLCGLTNVVWYDASNNVIDTGAPGLWVKPTNNTFYVIEQDVCGQYSRDTVYITVAPLPVIIDNYKLIIDNGIQNKVENVWTTSTEINVSHFNVQRSLDGVIFETVGRVKAKGAGKYSLTPNPSPLERGVTCYYRLEVVDKNGALSYSEVKELRIENGELIISPNPAKDFISISGGSVKEVRVSDVGGRVLLVGRDKKVDIRSLVNGTYIVQIETLNGNYSIHKFIKL